MSGSYTHPLIDSFAWKNADTSVLIDDRKYPCVSGNDWIPPRNKRADYFLVTSGKSIKKEPGHHYRFLGWVKERDAEKYVGVYEKTKRGIFSPVILAAALILASAFLLKAIFPKGSSQSQIPAEKTVNPSSYAGTQSTAEPAKSPSAIITYATYESPSDQTWKAGATKQEMRLALPPSVVDDDGNVTENTVDAAPHVYVDLNGDGEFSDDECVYNPMSKDSKGNITDYGTFLKSGTQLSEITLTKPLPTGKYDGEVIWTSVDKSTHTLVNPMIFKFNLAVQ